MLLTHIFVIKKTKILAVMTPALRRGNFDILFAPIL
jgi:hypothetical protein